MNGDRAKKEHLAICVFDDHQGKLGNRVQTMVDDIISKAGRNINYSAEQYVERHPIKTIRYVFDVCIDDIDRNRVLGIILDTAADSGLKGYIYTADCQYSNADVVEILTFFNSKMV